MYLSDKFYNELDYYKGGHGMSAEQVLELALEYINDLEIRQEEELVPELEELSDEVANLQEHIYSLEGEIESLNETINEQQEIIESTEKHLGNGWWEE